MAIKVPTINEVRDAVTVIREHFSPAPLIRSYPLEKRLGLPESRRVWIKDYGWTPVGSFKLMGALNWMANNCELIGERCVAAHSSGNFASGISFAGMRYGKRVIVVMPDNAPEIKFKRTRSFGAEVRTFNKVRDAETGERMKLSQQIAEEENAVAASPYDDPYVIAGNGVGGLEIVDELKIQEREISHFFCPVSGGGLMAGHALAIADGFPDAQIIAVEPEGAADFKQSFESGKPIRIDHPDSICDGLLSYSVGDYNWPILQRYISSVSLISDLDTQRAMKWIYEQHGLRSEPSGAIATAAVLAEGADLEGTGDIVIVLSGRNVDEIAFQKWIEVV
ncbi:MAG: pyridoxal-phosphate dependent enzyme [Verrucomicrobia bacterium]|nr:pyridoxal-phosphate dependent enzyme [Verrucomicrobiota bacterium]MDA1069504.1 pyridoxal-phosphate dependent enzyme [Verrucomicrobiota bacterium]